MKALLCKTLGGPEQLVLEDIPDPVPGPYEAVVRVQAAGVNFPDTLIIQGKYQFKPELPFSPGGECAGVVESVGEKVKNVKPGDSVIAFTGWGAFAEKVLCNSAMLIPIPPMLSKVTAAAFVMTYGTSYHALHDRAALKPEETLLVLGAAGGVGLAAIELAKAMGARVIACASTPEKLAVCKAHGADECVNYSDPDWGKQVKELTGGKGADVVYDAVGGIYSETAMRAIAWRGRFLVVGFANGEIPRLPLNLALLKGAAIVGVFWGDYAKREPANNMKDLFALFGLLMEGKVKPHVSQTFDLKDGAQAISALASRAVTGKVVITMGEVS